MLIEKPEPPAPATCGGLGGFGGIGAVGAVGGVGGVGVLRPSSARPETLPNRSAPANNDGKTVLIHFMARLLAAASGTARAALRYVSSLHTRGGPSWPSARATSRPRRRHRYPSATTGRACSRRAGSSREAAGASRGSPRAAAWPTRASARPRTQQPPRPPPPCPPRSGAGAAP